jgi:adenine deaminase
MITANYIDIFNKEIFPANVFVENGKIVKIERLDYAVDNYVLPGFIDAHIHIESSMLLPSAFAAIAVKHGTVATISDPHEIANVCGIAGVEYFMQNASKVPFGFNFGAPSCVPATSFETAGANLDAKAVDLLLQDPAIKYLSEMMNYPGVLYNDAEVLEKIAAAKKYNKPVDGHAPGLVGEDAIKYINAGISTDHECTTYAEALHKINHGMHILIREGSAAKNFDALINLLNDYPNQIMFCCDDKHPDELLECHINKHVKDALAAGIDLYKVLQAACVNPVMHYKIDTGLLRIGDAADFIVVDNLQDFNILQTCIKGEMVFDNNIVQMPTITELPINNFNCAPKQLIDFEMAYNGQTQIPVIEALDGQLITNCIYEKPTVHNNAMVSNTANDVLQLCVVNRYQDAAVANAFIKNFNLKYGAIASTVAHDCHNIIAVGADAKSICLAVNALIQSQGGLCVVDKNEQATILELPVAGLVSLQSAQEVGEQYAKLHQQALALGSTLQSPFMTLSFMALLVIPSLKLSDKGLFDGSKFEFVEW